MGLRNFLVEGLSGSGKTTVADELERRGYQVVHGDRVLAYRGHPETGEPVDDDAYAHHLWDVDAVRSLMADRSVPATFFCGGSRNCAAFLADFDLVFVLRVDLVTLNRRLDARPDGEWGGGVPTERALIERWHRTGETVPRDGIVIDSGPAVEQVADDILRRCELPAEATGR